MGMRYNDRRHVLSPDARSARSSLSVNHRPTSGHGLSRVAKPTVHRKCHRTAAVAGTCLMGGLLLSAALAAPAHSPAATRENLRPLWATPADVEDGKQIAQRFCADCHGPAGITSIPDVPNLAGQRGPYLLSEMRAFLAGERGNDTMNGAITYLTPTAMSNVAAYYASQDPAQPAVTGARADIDPMQSGRAAASGCAGCHGDAGVSKMPGVPNLVGLDPKYLVGAMAAYENGERKNHTMKVVLAAVPPTRPCGQT